MRKINFATLVVLVAIVAIPSQLAAAELLRFQSHLAANSRREAFVRVVDTEETVANQLPGRVQRTACRYFLENDFDNALHSLERWAERNLGRKQSLEEIYAKIRCDTPYMDDLDLLRVSVENPNTTDAATLKLFVYFRNRSTNPQFLSQMMLCKKYIGGQTESLNLFEHIEKNIVEARANSHNNRLDALLGLRYYAEKHILQFPISQAPASCPAFLSAGQK